jgi:hypothetical protein
MISRRKLANAYPMSCSAGASQRVARSAALSEYQTQLPDKKLLRAKLHEFYLQNAPEEVSERPSANRKRRIRKKVL